MYIHSEVFILKLDLDQSNHYGPIKPNSRVPPSHQLDSVSPRSPPTYPSAVVVSARPSRAPGVGGPWCCGTTRATVEVVSALAMVTSLALPTSSPQCGQKLWPFSTEAHARWKRWEMPRSGWHSMKVPWDGGEREDPGQNFLGLHWCGGVGGGHLLPGSTGVSFQSLRSRFWIVPSPLKICNTLQDATNP